jgi:hypothetical protein
MSVDELPFITWGKGGYWLDAIDIVAGVTWHATLPKVFAALETTEWFREATSKKAQPHGLAEPRWFLAAQAEDFPHPDGTQITGADIDAMVANLMAQTTPLVLDGAGVSAPFEAAWSPTARAAGWADAAVKVIAEGGRTQLWLRAALIPEAEAGVADGTFGDGHVAFLADDVDRVTGEPTGARVIAYTLAAGRRGEGE